jgi:hypothetical protein
VTGEVCEIVHVGRCREIGSLRLEAKTISKRDHTAM